VTHVYAGAVMKFLTDKRFEFIRDAGTSLYGWCIREEDNGRPLDLIPCKYSIFLTATVIDVIHQSEMCQGRDEPSRTIWASLRTGSPFTDHLRNGKPWLSMFGTSRAFKAIELKINRAKKDDVESCFAYAGIGYVDSNDHGYDSSQDYLEFSAYVSGERFDHMESLILSGRPIRLFFTFKKAEGFYATWSPDGDFSFLKLLTRDKPHEQPEPKEGEEPFPVVGKIGEFSVTITAKGVCMDEKVSDGTAHKD